MRTLLLFLLYIILAVALIPFLLFCYLAKRPRPLMSVGKWAIGLGQKILAVELNVRRSGRIDDHATYVFMGNHASFLDGPMLYMLIPQALLVILKKSLFRIPILGQAMRVVGFVPVDRRHSGGGKKSIEKAVHRMMEKGFSFLVFPEGTRSLDGRLQPLRRGGFFLALEARAPIVPVAIDGAFEIMPKGRFFVKKGKIRVDFLDPVPVEGYSLGNISPLVERIDKILQSHLKSSHLGFESALRGRGMGGEEGPLC